MFKMVCCLYGMKAVDRGVPSSIAGFAVLFVRCMDDVRIFMFLAITVMRMLVLHVLH